MHTYIHTYIHAWCIYTYIHTYIHTVVSRKRACHKKFGPPQNGSPRSLYFEIFGPPGTYISQVS